jgi:hypothetical protein
MYLGLTLCDSNIVSCGFAIYFHDYYTRQKAHDYPRRRAGNADRLGIAG